MTEQINNLVEDDAGDVWPWPFCITPECPNRVCMGISAVRCYVHLTSEQRARKDAQLKEQQ